MPEQNDQMNEREVAVLLRELERALTANTEGDIVELGCYKGHTSVLLGQAIKKLQPGKRLYLYDSFAGLPEKSREDQSPAGEQFRAGELPATKDEVIRRFKQTALPLPVVKKAWFSDLSDNDMPDAIAFAFLDGDFYDSVKDSLQLIWPHLADGAVVVVDDYQNEALPGAAQAVNEWLMSHTAKLQVEASLAVLRPE